MAVQEAYSRDAFAADGGLARADRVAEAKVRLRENGLAVIEGALSATELAETRQAFADVIEADRQAGVRLNGFAIDVDALNTRVVMLAAKHATFRTLAENPIALALAHEMLGERMRLTSFSANVTAPGSGMMVVHCDQGYIPSPWPPFAIGVNVGYALDDFTVENGATRYVPGSHRELHAPDPRGDYPQAEPVLCRAGALFAMDDRLWHRTGPNVTANETRIGLFAHYTRSYITPQENWRECMPAELQAGLSPSLRRVLGLDGHPARLIDDIHRAV